LIIAYQCFDCLKFHIGHADESQKIVRREAVSRLNTRCPNCNAAIPMERRFQAAESKNDSVYCSAKCAKKFGTKRAQARKREFHNSWNLIPGETGGLWVLTLMDAVTSTKSHPIEYLTVADVATILAVSDDTILKQFGALDGVIDIGTPGGLYRRRKRILRIPRRTLERYIADKQVKVRRR
jgi:predicted nucleic acid-binding Zn ribbon protein